MKESIYFSYNGVHSKDMGVMLVHNSGGLYSEDMFSTFQLNTEGQQKNGRVISSYKEKQPIEFPMTLYYKDNKQQSGVVNRIINWLNFEKGYAPMSFDTHPNMMVYAQLKEITSIEHNGLSEGVIQLIMTTNSHYIYSVPHLTNIYTVEEDTPLKLTLNHDGVEKTEPKIWIEKIGSGEFSIQNLLTKKTMVFEKLDDGEKLYIDNERRLIYSDGELVGVYRGNSHNRIWLQLENNYFDGTNELLIQGDAKVQFELQYKYYTAL